MPLEKPFIPEGMPNPIGNAVFEGIRNRNRTGGEPPKDFYPLVSSRPLVFNSSLKLVPTGDWERLQLILSPTKADQDQIEINRINGLKSSSYELKCGWLDTKQAKVERLAAMILEKKAKEEEAHRKEAEEILKEKELKEKAEVQRRRGQVDRTKFD